MNLAGRFLPCTEFQSYEDFRDHFRLVAPEDFNFAYDVVDVYAREVPGKRALVWCDDHGHHLSLTFADLSDLSQRAARALAALGIRKGDKVLIILKGHYHFWTILLALHRLGAVAVPASHLLSCRDLVYRVESAAVKMVICRDDGQLIPELDQAQAEVSHHFALKVSVGGEVSGWHAFDQLLAAAEPAFPRPTGEAAVRAADLALLYFSSGTSGLPKMVALSQSYPLGHILTAGYWQCVQDEGLHYTLADTGWAKCLWGKIYGQWIWGSAVLVYDFDQFDVERMLRHLADQGVTTFCAPPTVYRLLVKKDLSRFDLSRLRHAVTAGEPLHPATYERFFQLTGLRLREGYGQTELVITIATWPWLEPKPGSVGRPAPLFDLRLLRLDGEECPEGEEGEICIHATPGAGPPGMFLGYHHDPRRTREVWHDDLYHTGDIARRDADGYFWFAGRGDDIIKTAGYKVGPYEVESLLLEHPAVAECAVTGVPDPVRGAAVKASIVLAPGVAPSEELKSELRHQVKQATAAYKVPRVIDFVDKLPKTISGKVRRAAIRGGG